MAIFQMANKSKAGAVEDLERELASLNLQGAAKVAEIERLDLQKDELEDAVELVAAMGAFEAQRNQLKKIDARIAETRDRLSAAKDAARARLCHELLTKIPALGRAVIVKAAATQAAIGEFIAARDALRAAGFVSECAGIPIPPNINGAGVLAPDLLSVFEAALTPAKANRVRAGGAESPVGATVIAEPSAAQADPYAAPGGRRITLGAEPSMETAPPRALRRESAKDGEVLVEVMRSGLELSDGVQGVRGDVVSVPPATAHALMLNGAADLYAPPAAQDAAQVLEDAGATQ